MSREHWKERVDDMIQRIDWISEFTAGMTAEHLGEDVKTLLAVEAALSQLGEAAGRLPEDVREAHPEIEWEDIRRFRNFVVHVYDMIDPAKLLETVNTDLPVLRKKLLALK